METLPEFKVTLTRLKAGEKPYPAASLRFDPLGQRTKLGGEPDWIQNEETPSCPYCYTAMTFISQIDSVEHQSKSNPHSVNALSDDRKWMFGDVGMIYVFFCFECTSTTSVSQCS